MFGLNPQRPPALDRGGVLEVQDVFYTIQGEGPFSGRPAVFIRLAGCNLACFWCDTDFESSYQGPNQFSAQDVLQRVRLEKPSTARPMVVITGGEPFRQNLVPLIQLLLGAGYDLVQIETAGILPIPGELWVHCTFGRVVVVCSPKTPKVHDSTRRFCRHWKYVVGDGDVHPFDGLPYKPTQKEHRDPDKDFIQAPAIFRGAGLDDTIWVSPRDDGHPTQNLMNRNAAVNSCLEHGHRLSLQVHKIVGLA